jgi:DNA processing protein
MIPPEKGHLELLLRLNAVPGFSASSLRLALASLEGRGLGEVPPEALAAWGGWSLDKARILRDKALAFDAPGEFEEALRLGIQILGWEDPDYPDLLRSIPDAPLLLYVRGTLSQAATPLAIVGSRRPTSYGRRMARRLSAQASRAGCVIVSGLARGLDTEAHQAALGAGAATWAVLGSGLKRLYPPENQHLAEEIVCFGGAILSEFPLETPPLASNFPRRNRIISGLAWATLVVEGRAGSGSLITARLAAEQGREVFAVPGPADSPLSEVPHLLIREGAKAVGSAAEILEELPPGCRAKSKGVVVRSLGVPLLAKDQKKILESLGSDTLTLEELQGATGLGLSRLSAVLFEMELEDLVGPVGGQRYAKKADQ